MCVPVNLSEEAANSLSAHWQSGSTQHLVQEKFAWVKKHFFPLEHLVQSVEGQIAIPGYMMITRKDLQLMANAGLIAYNNLKERGECLHVSGEESSASHKH